MHLNCPECKSKFLVDPAQLGDKGRNVRCGECANIWFAEAPSEETQKEIAEIKESQEKNIAEALQAEAAGEKPQLPTVINTKPAPQYLIYAAIALLVLNVFAFIIYNKQIIGHTAFYDMIRQYNSQGIEISGVALAEPLEKEDTIYYYLDFEFKNNGTGTRNVPHKKVTLLDHDMKKIASPAIVESQGKLEPTETKTYTGRRVEDETKKARYLVLDIGNPSELASR